MADSQRKTANLFDKDNTTIYNAYFDNTGNWLLSDDSKSIKFPCLPDTQYTLSVPNTLAVFRIYESSNPNLEPSISSRATQITRNSNIKEYTFTTSSTAQILLFQGSNGMVDEWFNGLMLNTGSTALPYEPYGWLHSLRKLGTATDTIITLPVDLYADGNFATVGLQGNMTQTGTPTPTTPIQPSECGDMTGNLLNINDLLSAPSGIITREDGGAEYAVNHLLSLQLQPMTTYIMSTNYVLTGKQNIIYFNFADSTCSVRSNQFPVFTTDSTGVVKIGMFSERTGANEFINGTAWLMLNSGSTALPYEPYGIKIPILSANTTTPVYLGEVETERKIKKLVFDGTEDWEEVTSGNQYFAYDIALSPNVAIIGTGVCTHLSYATISASNTDEGFGVQNRVGNTRTSVLVRYNSFATLNDWKTYLAQQYANGTPVTVWYVLATPTTGIVNEPLRKIGAYADTVSGITIPTITGADSIDVQTTLKPSEVSLSYTGWHDATVKEWDGSEWD